MRIAVELRRRIAFAMLMGVATTGIISFVLVAVTLGMDSAFVRTWLRCWLISYLIVIPAILLVGPRLLAWVDRMFDDRPVERRGV